MKVSFSNQWRWMASLRTATVVAAVCSGAWAGLSAGQEGAGEAAKAHGPRKRVLVIDQEGATRPAFVLFMEGVRKGLASEFSQPFDVFVENLDLVRLERTASDVERAAGWLREKYGDTAFDVIVPTSRVSRDFVLAGGNVFSARANVVGVERPGVPLPSSEVVDRYSSVVSASPFEATVALAKQLFPAAVRVVYIAQSGPHPDNQTLAEREVRSAADGLGIEFVSLVDISIRETLAAVRQLPPDSIVVYMGHWGDAETGSVVPADIVADVCRESRAPVFGVAESYVGRGIVGGACANLVAMGEAAGQMVVAASNGARPESVVVPLVNIFDSRVLRRFGISQTQLPADSRVLFQEKGFWERYWLQATGIAFVLLLEATLIMLLVVNLRRRLAAEKMVSAQRELVIHAGRVSALGEFAASLAHELSQPLGAILNNVEAAEMLLRGDALAPGDVADLRAIISDIAADEQRAGDVLERLRAMVRKQRMSAADVDPLELFKAVQSLIGPRCATELIAITVDCPAGLQKMAGDRILLQQAVLNLVSNAIDAICRTPRPSRKGGGVTLRGRRTSDWIELSVIDDGGGMLENPEKSREAFYTTKEDGLGVGLAIVQSIMEQHDGRLELENQPGRGVTARLLVPTWHEGS